MSRRRMTDPFKGKAAASGPTALLTDDAPPHVLDVLRRAHGLAALPSALQLGSGAKYRLTDAELALLAG